MSSRQPLLVICGPTASGKSALAIQVALEHNGEIICADSRTIYKGMDIGTAKPHLKNQHQIKHHLLDVVTPDQAFTVYDFQQQAKKIIEDIRQRDKLPVMVGGTGLYIDSVIFDYRFPPKFDTEERDKLTSMNIEELHIHCKNNFISVSSESKNKRHIISAILRNGIAPRSKDTIIDNTFVVGIATKKEILMQNIIQRTEHLFENGVVDEAKKLGEMYGWDTEAMTGNIYPLARQVTSGDMTIQDAKAKFVTLDWRLAKRQLTWLKRNQFIHWGTQDELQMYIKRHLVSRQNIPKLLS